MEEGNESEQLSKHFTCAVCLDLLFKPIVLVCGHVTCFWCCYQSMDIRGQSHCPLCRHPYRHFPAICQMLDLFLKKMYPISYGRRKKQILEDKKHSSFCFALDEELHHLSIVDQPSRFISEDNLLVSSSPGENKSNDWNSGGNCKQVTVADVICSTCKQLLFQPVVLNCGHVYCESCITIPEDGAIKCQICECWHPSGFPKVCKELDYVLEKQFSSEYALRKGSIQLSQEQIQNRNLFKEANEQVSQFPYPPEENFLQWWTANGSKFHPGFGCDMCGMYPIVGDRYNCKDCCKEKNSYDLCGDCHKTDTKLPGRFNQKHTSQHRFELVKAAINHDVIYRLISGQLAVVSTAARSLSNGTPIFASSPVDGDGDDDGVVPRESAIDSREGQSSNQNVV